MLEKLTLNKEDVIQNAIYVVEFLLNKTKHWQYKEWVDSINRLYSETVFLNCNGIEKTQ